MKLKQHFGIRKDLCCNGLHLILLTAPYRNFSFFGPIACESITLLLQGLRPHALRRIESLENIRAEACWTECERVSEKPHGPSKICHYFFWLTKAVVLESTAGHECAASCSHDISSSFTRKWINDSLGNKIDFREEISFLSVTSSLSSVSQQLTKSSVSPLTITSTLLVFASPSSVSLQAPQYLYNFHSHSLAPLEPQPFTKPQPRFQIRYSRWAFNAHSTWLFSSRFIC